MYIWIAVAIGGGAIFAIGAAAAVSDYRSGRMSRGDILLHALAAVMVIPIVLTTIFLGTPEDPSPGMAIFLPLWLALLAVIHQRRRRGRTSTHEN